MEHVQCRHSEVGTIQMAKEKSHWIGTINQWYYLYSSEINETIQ